MEFVDIDPDIPLADYPPTYESLRERIAAALNTVGATHDKVFVSDADMATARELLNNPDDRATTALESPGVVVHIQALLSEYDRAVIKSAAQIRNYVTNRLLVDSNHKDPRIRLRCYELLGKISDVGLFTEKSEVTMRHRPTEELEQLLRERLMRTLDMAPPDSDQKAEVVPHALADMPPEGVPSLSSPDAI